MYQGRYWKIDYARLTNGNCPVKDFIDSLNEREQAKFAILLRKVADVRNFNHIQKFKKLSGRNLWQFRSDDYRLLCYQLKNIYILTNGFRKDQNKTNPKYIELAIKIKDEDMLRRK